MKKLFWILTVALLAFTACVNKERPSSDPEGIAMIVKNGSIEYFRQIETSFRSTCQEKGLEAYYYSTSSETAYQEQLAAVKELRSVGRKALKGIIFAPAYGINGENAEAEVATLALERGIPVVILDSPVKANGPLASCPYVGTDNAAAGEAMAKLISADRVAVFAMINSPGIERATAFKALKPNAEVFRVGDTCIEEVKAVLDKYDDFVFFNGNDLMGALPMLKAAGKRVYTFDVYGEFLDELIAGSPCLKGVMAQNTFAMATKAVEAVLSGSRQGEMVPTFYINAFNLDADEVKPYLDFYDKQIPNLNVAEKIIGKWMPAEIDGKPAPTNEKMVTTFISTTKAIVCSSKADFTEKDSKWNVYREDDVVIVGNKVTLTGHPNEHTTLINEYYVSSITNAELTGKWKHITLVDGVETVNTEKSIRLDKVADDFRQAVIGTWQGRCTSEGSAFDDGQEHRWEYREDGTYTYYRKDYNTWKRVNNSLNEYFVDGNLLCARWIDNGVEYREWWEITIDGDTMKWTALRQKEDGTPYTVTFQMSKALVDNVRLTQTYMVVAFVDSGNPLTSATEDYFWEDGLLLSSQTSIVMHSTGSTLGGSDTYVYDDNGNCIEMHYVNGKNASMNHDAYFVYDDQNRLTSGVDKNNEGEITTKSTITGYTDDGYVQALTVEFVESGNVYEYQLTWENGDMTSYARHSVSSDQEDIVVAIEYDDYPNYKTGMPVAPAIFDPESFASLGSVHNWYALNDVYSYDNGRLVKSTGGISSISTTTYLTYSDGTTGRKDGE